MSKRRRKFIEVSASNPLCCDGELYALVFVGDQGPCWYNVTSQFQSTVTCIYDEQKKAVPFIIKNLMEHKLCIEHSPAKDYVLRNKDQTGYPTSC